MGFRPVFQQDLCDEVFEAGVEGFGEKSQDLLWRHEVIEDDVTRESVERLDQLRDAHQDNINVVLMIHSASILYRSNGTQKTMTHPVVKNPNPFSTLYKETFQNNTHHVLITLIY